MLTDIGAIRNIFVPKIVIHHPFYRIYSVWTPVLMSVLYIISTSREQFGRPIICAGPHKSSDMPIEFWESACWNFGTYVLKTKGYLEIHPGVSQSLSLGHNERSEQDYHRHVWMAFLSAIFLSRLPYWLWTCLEKRVMKTLCQELKDHWIYEDRRQKHVERVINFIMYEVRQKKMYMAMYFFCNCMHVLVNIISWQLFNSVIHNQLWALGISFFSSEETNQVKILDRLFPMEAKCQAGYFGPSGSFVNMDLLCALPINSAYRIMFPLICFWYGFTTILGILFVAIEFAFSSSPTMASKGKIFGIWEITDGDREAFNKCHPNTIFILTQIERNVNPFVYQEILAALMQELDSAHGKV